MGESSFKVYGYRWVVLLVFMVVVAINQLLWITFAPITSEAASYYHVSDLSIGLLSLVFLLVYIIASIPASWAIDTWGIRIAVGIGAALTGIFGLARGLVAPDFTLVLLAQVGIAFGQPFILNATTTVAARWFAAQDRATATGLGSLAIYLGILAGLALTPRLVEVYGIGGALWIYGIGAVLVTVLFFALIRERPPTPAEAPSDAERSLVWDGLKQALRQRNFVLLLLIFFVGLGVFNAVTTWIEEIVKPRGFTITQAGDAGGLMIVGGILGALVMPMLSDRYRRRVPFLILAVAAATLGLIGITFAQSYTLLLVSSFILGFFLLSAGPIGFQYGAEITYPTPEGTSNGLLLLMGQISGILFIFGMDSLKSPGSGSMTLSLLVLIGLMVVGLVLATRLGEARTLVAGGEGRVSAQPAGSSNPGA